MREYHTYFTTIVDRFAADREWSVIQKDPMWLRLTSEAQKALAVLDQKT